MLHADPLWLTRKSEIQVGARRSSSGPGGGCIDGQGGPICRCHIRCYPSPSARQRGGRAGTGRHQESKGLFALRKDSCLLMTVTAIPTSSQRCLHIEQRHPMKLLVVNKKNKAEKHRSSASDLNGYHVRALGAALPSLGDLTKLTIRLGKRSLKF